MKLVHGVAAASDVGGAILRVRPAALLALWIAAVAPVANAQAIWLTYHPPERVTYHARTIVTTRLEGEIHSGPPTDLVRTVFYSTTAMVDSTHMPWLSVAIDSVTDIRGGVGEGTLGSSRAALFVWGSPFDNRRDVTTDTTDVRVRVAHRLFDSPVLDGTVSFPADSVRVGQSWKSAVDLRIVGWATAQGMLHGTAKVKLKDITVTGADTTVTLSIHYSLEGPQIYDTAIHQGARIFGSLDGTERFSLTRGVTRSLDIQGRLSYEFDIRPGTRPTTPFDVEWHRTLLDDH
jgi:hypothetical protein